MNQYLELVQRVLRNGSSRRDRTGVGTFSLFGERLVFPHIHKEFPLVTTKRVNFKAIVQELLWFIKGSTNIKDLGNKIWDEWADSNGDLGPIYGHQWRHWGNDQLLTLLKDLRENPTSRRHIISAWNVEQLPDMALAPCHVMTQFYVEDGYIDCQLYQRSADLALGVPFNIASYALLLTLIANELGLVPRHLYHIFGDVHIYKNHLQGLKEQLTREPYPLPIVRVKPKRVIDVQEDDISLIHYNHYPPIKFVVAV